MDDSFPEEPLAGSVFNFDINDHTRFSLHIGAFHMAMQCPDPPCHQAIWLPISVEGQELVVESDAGETIFSGRIGLADPDQMRTDMIQIDTPQMMPESESYEVEDSSFFSDERGLSASAE